MAEDLTGIGKATSEAVSLLKEPVRTLFGPFFEQIAGAWGDQARHWRDMKRIELAIEAVRKLDAKGIPPKAVDPSILFPILDAGSLVEDETLKGKWTTLLANASSAKSGVILPAFARILSELSPFEALLLDDLSMPGNDEDGRQEWRYLPVEVRNGMERVSETLAPLYGAGLYEANFIRLGLLHQTPLSAVDEIDMLKFLDHVNEQQRDSGVSVIRMNDVPPVGLRSEAEYYFFTPLGIAFVEACRDE